MAAPDAMPAQRTTAPSGSPLHQHLVQELRRRTIDLLSALDAARPTAEAEAVHALRLAARHLQAIVRLLHAVHPAHQRDRRMRRTLRNILRGSGGLRDAQVQLGRITGTSPRSPVEHRSRMALERSRKQELKVFRSMVKELDRNVLLAYAARSTPSVTSAQVDLAVRRVVQAQRAKVHTRIRALEPFTPERLHRARVALKRYRAMLLLTTAPDDRKAALHLTRTKELLDRLGTWHDLHVRHMGLEQLRSTLPLRAAKALGDHLKALTRRIRSMERALTDQLVHWAQADAHRSNRPHPARITPRSKRRSPPQRRRNISGRARKPTA